MADATVAAFDRLAEVMELQPAGRTPAVWPRAIPPVTSHPSSGRTRARQDRRSVDRFSRTRQALAMVCMRGLA